MHSWAATRRGKNNDISCVVEQELFVRKNSNSILSSQASEYVSGGGTYVLQGTMYELKLKVMFWDNRMINCLELSFVLSVWLLQMCIGSRYQTSGSAGSRGKASVIGDAQRICVYCACTRRRGRCFTLSEVFLSPFLLKCYIKWIHQLKGYL